MKCGNLPILRCATSLHPLAQAAKEVCHFCHSISKIFAVYVHLLENGELATTNQATRRVFGRTLAVTFSSACFTTQVEYRFEQETAQAMISAESFMELNAKGITFTTISKLEETSAEAPHEDLVSSAGHTTRERP